MIPAEGKIRLELALGLLSCWANPSVFMKQDERRDSALENKTIAEHLASVSETNAQGVRKPGECQRPRKKKVMDTTKEEKESSLLLSDHCRALPARSSYEHIG